MKAIPHICPVCKARGSYYGRLVFPEELLALDEIQGPAVCPNHPKGSEPVLIPVAPRQRRVA